MIMYPVKTLPCINNGMQVMQLWHAVFAFAQKTPMCQHVCTCAYGGECMCVSCGGVTESYSGLKIIQWIVSRRSRILG